MVVNCEKFCPPRKAPTYNLVLFPAYDCRCNQVIHPDTYQTATNSRLLIYPNPSPFFGAGFSLGVSDLIKTFIIIHVHLSCSLLFGLMVLKDVGNLQSAV